MKNLIKKLSNIRKSLNDNIRIIGNKINPCLFTEYVYVRNLVQTPSLISEHPKVQKQNKQGLFDDEYGLGDVLTIPINGEYKK